MLFFFGLVTVPGTPGTGPPPTWPMSAEFTTSMPMPAQTSTSEQRPSPPPGETDGNGGGKNTQPRVEFPETWIWTDATTG